MVNQTSVSVFYHITSYFTDLCRFFLSHLSATCVHKIYFQKLKTW